MKSFDIRENILEYWSRLLGTILLYENVLGGLNIGILEVRIIRREEESLYRSAVTPQSPYNFDDFSMEESDDLIESLACT